MAAAKHPLSLSRGMRLLHHEVPLLHVGYLGSWQVDIRTEDGTPFALGHDAQGEPLPVDIDWILEESLANTLVDADSPLKPIGGRRAVFLKLPHAACIARDPKAAARHAWASAALDANLPRSLPRAEQFIKERLPDLPTIEVGARTLINWMVQLNEDPRRRIGNLVSSAGRLDGQSQLPPSVNAIVHQEVATYWTGEHPTRFDAAADVLGTFEEMQEAGELPAHFTCPSYETVRARINKLESSLTIEAREGRHKASRFMEANGEPVEVTRPFERVTLDGVTHRQITVFSDEWDEATARMKSVFGMDMATTYIFPGQTFSGPFCPEMTRGALMGMMCPVERMEDDPEDRAGSDLAAPAETLHPDNDKALLPPGSIPGLVNVVSVCELPRAFHSDAKATHENFHAFLHRRLSNIPGTVIPIHPGRDPRYDPVSVAEISRARFAYHVELARRTWNNEPKKSLGNRSPIQAMRDAIALTPPRFIPPQDIELELGRTVELTITPDGAVYDNLRYRWNRPGLQHLLDLYHRETPKKDRNGSAASCKITAVVYDHDLGFIDLLDRKGARHCRLEAVDRAYTAGLTRLEHREYHRMMRKGFNNSQTIKDRMRERNKTQRDMRMNLPNVSFRRRSIAAALLEREEFRRLSGAYGSSPKFVQEVSGAIPTDIADLNREDKRRAPPMTSKKSGGIKRAVSDDDYDHHDEQTGTETNNRGGTVDDEDSNYGAIRWSDDEMDDEEE